MRVCVAHHSQAGEPFLLATPGQGPDLPARETHCRCGPGYVQAVLVGVEAIASQRQRSRAESLIDFDHRALLGDVAGDGELAKSITMASQR